jgi:hypothetical protein
MESATTVKIEALANEYARMRLLGATSITSLIER